MNNKTDTEIIHEVLAGNTVAFSVLVDKYKDKAFILAYNIITNREDAEEISQDAFIKAFKGLQSFREESSFSTWLYRIVANTALNRRKGKKISFVDINNYNRDEDYDESNFYKVWQDETIGDKKKLVQQALQALRDEERICLTLFYINELSITDIHQLTNISASNIKVILHRGRKHVHEQLVALLDKEIDSLL